MKKSISVLFLILLVAAAFSQEKKSKQPDPKGIWNFEAPYAPEGFTTGKITVGQEEKVYTATISFTGNDYKIPGENVKFEGDSLRFVVYIEGDNINIILKIESDSAMSGKAVYSAGEIPLTLKKEPVRK